MDLWTIVAELLVLLAAAFVLGMVFERLRQSAIIGYLLAGALLGPYVLDQIEGEQVVRGIAELGVALLLFVVGLEFSLRRLVRMGPIGLGGGTVQVVLTCLAAGLIGWASGLDGPAAMAVGAMIALSSTACVLRVLFDRTALASVHGRGAVGILLVQDLAVVPLLLVVSALGGEGGAGDVAAALGRALLFLVGLIVVFELLARYVLVPLLRQAVVARSRELLILLAVVVAFGSAWAAHYLDLSPALGAFMAGLLLAESPFAVQIRADVGAIRTLFLTLFFASIGMLADPRWIVQHAGQVAVILAVVLVGKTVIITVVAVLFRCRLRHAVAVGLCLAQVGEFSFVIADVAYLGKVIDEHTFRLFVSATVVTLMITPYLVAAAPAAGRWCERLVRRGGGAPADDDEDHAEPVHRDHVIVVGFGPAGQRAAEVLRRRGLDVLVIDLQPRNVQEAQRQQLAAVVGDATSAEVWRQMDLSVARAVAVTVPHHATAIQVIHRARSIAPHVPVIVRARDHVFLQDMTAAGALAVVDEEHLAGRRLGREVSRRLRLGPSSAETADDQPVT